MLPGTEAAQLEFKAMVGAWRTEKAAYEKSEEHRQQQRAKQQKSADKGALERERGELAMAMAAQTERNREDAEARVDPVARLVELKALLGDEGADPPNGTAEKMRVPELKALVVAYGKHVGKGKKVDVLETRPNLLEALRTCASEELRRREPPIAAAPATAAAPTDATALPPPPPPRPPLPPPPRPPPPLTAAAWAPRAARQLLLPVSIPPPQASAPPAPLVRRRRPRASVLPGPDPEQQPGSSQAP